MQLASEKSRADDNAAGAASWKHRASYLEGERDATMRRLRDTEDATTKLREQLQGKGTQLQVVRESRSLAAAETTALQQEVQALQNKVGTDATAVRVDFVV